jgi:hypothetical protein
VTSPKNKIPDGWALMVGPTRNRVKGLTYDLRMSDAAIAALRDAGIEPNDAFALDWRRVDGHESYLVLIVSGRLVRVDPATKRVVPAPQQDTQDATEDAAYVKALLEGPLMTEECDVLTQWLRASEDPLPRRLRREFVDRGVALTGVAVADALVRNIDEVLVLALSNTAGALELTYDFSVGLSEDAGVVRSWNLLKANDTVVFAREFAVAGNLLIPSS